MPTAEAPVPAPTSTPLAKTPTTAALARAEKHDDTAPFRRQMDAFITALNSDDARMGKVMSGPAAFSEYRASFSSDEMYEAFGVNEPNWLRMQAQIAVLLRARFEAKTQDDVPSKGHEKIASLFPPDGDLTSDAAVGLGSRAYLAIRAYYEGKSDDEIYELDAALDAADWGDERDDEQLSVFLARLTTTNDRIKALDPTSPYVRDARWFLVKMRRALDGLTHDNGGGARDIYADLGRKLAKPREFPQFAPGASPTLTTRNLEAFIEELADSERAIARAIAKPTQATRRSHALFSTRHSDPPAAAANSAAIEPGPDDKSAKMRRRVGAALRGENRSDGRPFFNSENATCWNCGKKGHTQAYCPGPVVNDGEDHKPKDYAPYRRRRSGGENGGENGPASSHCAVALMAGTSVCVKINATDATVNCEENFDFVDGGSSHSLYGDKTRAEPGSLRPHRVPIVTPTATTFTEYIGTVITPIARNDGTTLEWKDEQALFASECGTLGLKSESRMLEAGVSIVKTPRASYLMEDGDTLIAWDDPKAMPLERSPKNGLFQIPRVDPKNLKVDVIGDGKPGTYLVVSFREEMERESQTSGTAMSAMATSENATPKGMGIADLVELWQSRLGFPPPVQLEAILRDTTGHGIPEGSALKHAKPVLLWQLANQNAAPKRHVSASQTRRAVHIEMPRQPRNEPRSYEPFVAWSLDWQQFGPSVTGLRYALNFVEHTHRLLHSVYVCDTGSKTTIEAIEAHRGYVRSTWGAEVGYYWHDADRTLLSSAVGKFLDAQGIKRGHSPPHLHHKNDKVERKHKSLHRLTVILRFSGRLPPEYWPRAHARAVEIANITPTSANQDGHSPLRAALGGKKPDIKHFRRFGCPVFMHKQRRSKEGLELRARPTINLGTAPNCPGAAIVLDIRDKCTIESAELVFDEAFDHLEITTEPGPLSGLQRPASRVVRPFEELIAEYEDDPATFEFQSDHPVALWEPDPEADAGVGDAPALAEDTEPEPKAEADVADGTEAATDDATDDADAPRYPQRVRNKPNSVPAYMSKTSLLSWMANENTVAYAAYELAMFEPIEPPLALATHRPSRGSRALRLLKGLYGTKQGGRLWHERFVAALRALGFKPTMSDPCCFERWDSGLCAFVFIWVDDSFITGSDSEFIAYACKLLTEQFGGGHGPINSFLGMHVVQDLRAGTITLKHTAYRRNIFDRFRISPELKRGSAIPDGLEWSPERGPILLANYRAITAAWMFDAISCAPWECTALNKLAKRMHEPAEQDAIRLDAFMRFMANHIDTPFIYRQRTVDPEHLIVDFSDSSFADKDDEKLRSTTGFIGFTAGNITHYKCSTQSTTAKATNEAELIAAASAVNEAVHKRNLISELGMLRGDVPSKFFVDNNGVLLIGKGETGLTFRNKHLATKVHNMRDYCDLGELDMGRIDTKANPADFFTKLHQAPLSSFWTQFLSGQYELGDLPDELAAALNIFACEPRTCPTASTQRTFNISLPEIKDAAVTPRNGETAPGAVTIDENHPEIVKVLNRLPAEHRAAGLGAMYAEMNTLNDYCTWVWSDACNPPLECRFVERVKYKGDGSFDKVKMRNVVRGFLQVEGIDFGSTYSPTGMISTARILLALAAYHGWPCYEYDAKNAYCHGVMDVDLWVLPPPGVHLA